jgi:CNT family concentrative nucleoside transporter
MDVHNLISFLGIFVICGVGWLCSAGRRHMNWSVIGWGIGLQLLFGLFIFTLPGGSQAFLWLNDAVVKVLDTATAGTRFVFGSLALPPGTPGSLGFFLAFQALPTIIFFSALMAVLYYLKIMPLLIRGFAALFSRLMKVSGAEALCTASNIFVGVESAFVIRPHLADMTRSELTTVLTAGMATVASNVLALYVFTLQRNFPTIAGHLISASLLAAPAALVMSKIIVPERQQPKTLGQSVSPHYQRENNIFEAVINGANGGLKVIAGIVALLIAVLGLVALFDLLLNGVGLRLNTALGLHIDWSLRGLLGYLFYPLTLALGVPLDDAWTVAKIIGERVVLTEVTAYQDLAAAIAAGSIHHARSALIASYALCGFAHVASVAIFVGGTAALAPGRTQALSKLALRALIAATLACLMTACVAGTFFNNSSSILLR